MRQYLCCAMYSCQTLSSSFQDFNSHSSGEGPFSQLQESFYCWKILLKGADTKRTGLKEDSGFLFSERDNKLSEIRLLIFPLGMQNGSH